MTTAIIETVKKQQSCKDCEHLVKPLMQKMWVTVLLILIWGAGWKIAHFALRQGAQSNVHDAR